MTIFIVPGGFRNDNSVISDALCLLYLAKCLRFHLFAFISCYEYLNPEKKDWLLSENLCDSLFWNIAADNVSCADYFPVG
jgi:hypothetical protein